MFDNTSISFVFITDGIPKKIRSLVVLLIVISLYSCRHSQCYKYDVTELSIDSIYSDTLVGSPIPINMENVDVIYCIDTVFLVHRTARYDKYYYNVYSNITFDSITSFGIKGRSRHEFTMSPMNFTKQVFVRNGDYIIPLMDNAVCKEINLNKTLSQGFTYVEQMTEGVNFLNGTVVFFGENYDRLFVFIKGTADNIYEEDEVLPKIVYANENGKEEVTSVYYHYPPNYTDDESSLFYDLSLIHI